MPAATAAKTSDYRSNVRWVNRHQNITIRAERLYNVSNRWPDGTRPQKLIWQAGLEALRRIVREAEAQGKQVRALGGGLSLSEAAVTRDFLVNTKALNYIDIGLRPQNCDPAFVGAPERLVFAQCGASVLELNHELERKHLALPTSGSSNGQTIAGAISTGTHGAANQFGSMQDCVLGLHLVTEGGVHLWLERASRPVVSERFCETLGAELRRDDRLFEAALVSFGSFGLIHAVLFEAAPIYLLERHLLRHDYATVRRALGTLDVSALGLPDGATLPFHFEIVLNPYRTGTGERGAYVRSYYKRPFQDLQTFVTRPESVVFTVPGDDLLDIMGALGDQAPKVYPDILDDLMDQQLKTISGTIATPGQTFVAGNIRGPVLSTEIGVALADAERAVDAIIATARRFPYGGTIALRFVKTSPALLALTRFSPITCTIELPSVGTRRSAEALRRIWAELEAQGIRFTLHWGQALPDDSSWMRRAFDARLDDWLSARRNLLSPQGRRTFSNDLLIRYGLAS
jgi:hypothetical protein